MILIGRSNVAQLKSLEDDNNEHKIFVNSALQSDSIINGTSVLTPKFIKANVNAGSTDSVLVAGVSSKKIRVLGYQLLPGATATDVTFNSKPGGASAEISMLHALAARSGFSSGFSPLGFFETLAGEALTVTTGSGSTVGIQLQYIEV